MFHNKLTIYTLIFINLFFINTGSFSQNFQNKDFSKKEIIAVPNFEKVKNKLPEPILEENKEWLDLYWLAWKIAFSNIKAPQSSSPLVTSWIDEGLTEQIFQWDTNLMTMFGRYAFHIFPFVKSNDNFYAAQHADGMICRVINELDGTDHEWGQGENLARAINPPLFGWSEIETYMFTGDVSRLKKILPTLEKYAKWIEINRTDSKTEHKLYWSNGQASGMDNTARDNDRTLPLKGGGKHSAYDPMGWVDLSSQMVMFYNHLSFICEKTGEQQKSIYYKNLATNKTELINKYMWNDSTGLYHDITPDCVQTPWKTVASFWPMVAQISSKEQAEKLVANILNPSLFWRPLPLPSLAADEKQYDVNGRYWLGSVWAPTSYMVVKGLNIYGYNETASTIAEKFLNSMYQVYLSTGTIWETYSPEMFMPATNATGKYMCQKDFVGWSGLVPISMLIEDIIGIDVNAPENVITWRIQRKDKHGLKKLRFGKTITSLEISKKQNDTSRIISVISNRPYTLTINNENYQINTGKNSISVNL